MIGLIKQVYHNPDLQAGFAPRSTHIDQPARASILFPTALP
jgi:hypothetical protein